MPEENNSQAILISPLDPDWLLMLFFAMTVDAVDILLEIFSFIAVPKLIGIASDAITMAVIGGWQAWRIGRMTKSKKQQQKALVKKLESQLSKLKKAGSSTKAAQGASKLAQKAMAKIARKPFTKALKKGAIAIIGEIIPFIGLIPFWTISVFMMLKETGE